MKWMTVRICMVFLLLVSAGTIAQAQQSAFQGTWIGEYGSWNTDYRLEISGTAWSYFIGDIIQGAGTARFSAGGAELLLANGSIYSSLTLLAPGYIQASGKIYLSLRIMDVALVEAKAVEIANAYYKSGKDWSLGDVENWLKYDAKVPSYLFREIWRRRASPLLLPIWDLDKKEASKKFDKGDYDGAIADFTEAIRLAPNYVYAYKQRGVAYSRKGDYDRAIADFEAALRINPNLAGKTRDEIERELELARQARGGVATSAPVVTSAPEDFIVVNGNVVTGYRGKGGNVIIPYGITTIGDRAFINTGLTSVTIPASVTRIGDYAFSGCTGLTSVTFHGTIARGSDSFGYSSFPGDLASKYFAVGGGIGTYTRSRGSDTWTKQR